MMIFMRSTTEPTIVALLERGAHTVCTQRTPPHETHRALGDLGSLIAVDTDAAASADVDMSSGAASPLADALLMCAASGTEAQRARVVLLSSNAMQVAHDVLRFGQVKK